MKTRMKQLISLLCIVTVFASAVLSTNFLSAKAETNSEQLETLPTDMTEITFRDFGISDNDYTKWGFKTYTGETLDNTLFSGMVTFPKVAEAAFIYIGSGGQLGLGLYVVESATGEWNLELRHSNTKLLTNQTITAATAGVEQLVGVPLELHISVEYEDLDNGGTNNDLKFGLWFGDTLYQGKYIYINNYVGADRTGNVLTYITKTGTMTLKSLDRMPEDMTEITFEDFGIADDTYSNTFSATYDGTTMDRTLFSGKIKFSATGETHFMYGGTRSSAGFILTNVFDEDNNDYYLRLYDSNADKDNGGTKKLKNDLKFYADKVGIDTFVDKEFELTYTLEYVNNDNGSTKNDLKLGVWFNGKLYEGKYIYINDYVDNGHSIGNYITVWNRFGATISLKSCNYQLPDDMTDISFRDYGIGDNDYTRWGFKAYTGETLDNTLFSGTVTFPQVAEAALIYAGSGGQLGLGLYVVQSATGEWNLELRHSNTKLLTNQRITAATAGVKQLVGVPLELHISMEYVNLDDGGTSNDLKLGVWFGDSLYQDEYIYIKNYVGADRTGNILTYITKTGTMTLKSSDLKLPKDMTEISFRNFGFEDGKLSGRVLGEYDGETLDNTLFSGKVTLPKPTLSTNAAGQTVAQKTIHLDYGGKVEGGGIELATGYDAAKDEFCLRLRNPKSGAENPYTFNETKFYSGIAGVELFDKAFDLSISLEYIDLDNGGTENDVKLGVWFNGKLYNNLYIYLYNFVDNNHSMGTWMTLSQLGGASTKIESVKEFDWKTLPQDMTEISFWDFGFTDSVPKGYGEYDGDSLDGTLFSGKIIFPKPTLGTDDTGATVAEGTVHLGYGGKVKGGGIELATGYDIKKGQFCLRLRNPKGGAENPYTFEEIKFYSDTARVNLFDNELDLNISLEYIDRDGGGTKNDVKLGVWFNGKLYNNRYVYLYNFVDNNHSMGTWMSFAYFNGARMQVKSVGDREWKILPEGMTEISFRNFGLRDGNVSKSWTYGEYDGDTLNNTLFSGKITLPKPTLETNDKGETVPKGTVHLIYGGKDGGAGIELATGYDQSKDEFCLRLRDSQNGKDLSTFDELRLYADVAGIELFDKELDLNLSLEYIDRDGDGKGNDVKIGIWLNGKLYNNRYIYLYDYVDNNTSMGTWMTIVRNGGAITSIKSAEAVHWKPLPTGLKELGFSDFGIKSGVYEGGTKTGLYEGDSLKNTLFSGVVTWHPEVGETHFIYGGTTGGGGIDLVNVKDEKTGEEYLRLFYTTPDKDGKKIYTNYYFYSDMAGVKLIGEELNLKISMEFIDHDGGSKKDDLKLGIWFAGKLYNNRYIYIDNYEATGHSLKNNLQIWNRNGASFSVGRMSEWLNWKAFGLNANWKKTLLDTDFNLEYALAGGNPYTGDDTQIPYLAMGLSLALVVICGFRIVRRRLEEYDVQ